MSDVDSTEAFRKIFSASCRPPPLPSRDAAAAAAPADWVLLEPLAYVADQRNATTAEASSSTGHTVQVTVCLTDPLGVSYVCVHCPGFKDTDYAARPSIVCSEKDFLLLSVIFLSGLSGSQGREYFVYKAGPGRPSLQLIPDNNARDLTLKDLLASHPVLSLTCHCDDVVYMLCKPKSCNPKAWLVTVDLKKKILVELAPFSLEGYFSTAHPSELSSYLNTAPATEGTSGP